MPLSKLQELVHIVEHPKDYQESWVDVAHEALNLDGVDHDEAKKLATEYMRQKCIDLMKVFSPLNDKLETPFSHYLSKEEATAILKEVFDEYMERRDSFGIDVWSYAVGGG